MIRPRERWSCYRKAQTAVDLRVEQKDSIEVQRRHCKASTWQLFTDPSRAMCDGQKGHLGLVIHHRPLLITPSLPCRCSYLPFLILPIPLHDAGKPVHITHSSEAHLCPYASGQGSNNINTHISVQLMAENKQTMASDATIIVMWPQPYRNILSLPLPQSRQQLGGAAMGHVFKWKLITNTVLCVDDKKKPCYLQACLWQWRWAFAYYAEARVDHNLFRDGAGTTGCLGYALLSIVFVIFIHFFGEDVLFFANTHKHTRFFGFALYWGWKRPSKEGEPSRRASYFKPRSHWFILLL